jgi:hypothetical protein
MRENGEDVSEKMGVKDGREAGMEEQTGIMRLLHRFGWLRTRDLASLSSGAASKTPPKGGPMLQPPIASPVDIRRIQRHLSKLRERRMVLMTQAPNGSWIYALSEKGARALQGFGLPASTGKDMLRRYHAAFFLHRNVANEVAISAMLQGFRVSTEREIAQGRWLGGADGVMGKKPDVVLKSGNDVWFVEVERSHRNRKDYDHLMRFLLQIWRDTRLGEAVDIDGTHRLRQVIFICTTGFEKKLSQDLFSKGWKLDELRSRVRFETSLYSFKAIAFY